MDFAENNAKSMVRSCITCAKAKAKCVKQPGAHICERCTRLKKECHSKEPVLRRKKPVKPTRTAQLEKLEHKIEDLVNALSTNAQNHHPSEHGQLSPPVSVSQAPRHHGENGMPNRTTEVLHSLCGEEESQSCSPQLQAPSATEASTETPKVEDTATGVTTEEAETLLDRYRRLMAAGNPFVVLSDSATVESMTEHRPILLRAICTVALIHDLSRQQAMVKELLRDIGVKTLTNNEKSIDILQGIVVMILWFHPHIFWSQQTTNLLYLAMAMANDLGIDRLGGYLDFRQNPVKAMHPKSQPTAAPAMEERRVLLALFFTTSMLSVSFKKMSAMNFTPYMEDCLTALEQAREYDSDLFLVQMVRIQRTTETIHTTEVTSAPIKAHTKAFKYDIERLRNADPCQEDNLFLRMEYLTAEILVWEVSLNTLIEDKSRQLANHIEDLYRLVAVIKAFFDMHFTIPPSAYLLLPFSVYGQFAHAFICLTKLASLEVEGWDVKILNEVVNFSACIDEAARRFDEASRMEVDGRPVQNDAFARWSARVRWMKSVYEARFAAQDSEGCTTSGAQQEERREETHAEQQHTQVQQHQQPTPPDDILSADIFTYWDDALWQNFACEFDVGGFAANGGMDFQPTGMPTT